ncbi:MAG: hypothetical protein KDK30_00105 [Leptospiraceae bacterium]|nr:hypothetical protein [Leptospiraceae bacterium]MCB1319316.1 hypothetical protein [Leptospiraceae bacterium]
MHAIILFFLLIISLIIEPTLVGLSPLDVFNIPAIIWVVLPGLLGGLAVAPRQFPPAIAQLFLAHLKDRGGIAKIRGIYQAMGDVGLAAAFISGLLAFIRILRNLPEIETATLGVGFSLCFIPIVYGLIWKYYFARLAIIRIEAHAPNQND